VKLASEVIKDFSLLKKIESRNLETFLQFHNSQIIGKYLLGFVQCRIKAYQTKSPSAFAPRIKQLTNLAYYLGRKNQNPQAIYSLAIKWEALLINSLPSAENISHAKVKACISSSRKNMQAYAAQKPYSIHTHQLQHINR
jgi:hypothetical protein